MWARTSSAVMSFRSRRRASGPKSYASGQAACLRRRRAATCARSRARSRECRSAAPPGSRPDRAPATPRSPRRAAAARARACAATRSTKLPPSEKPTRYGGRPGKRCCSGAHRADHLGQAAGVEQVPVEVMGLAVIAQVEAQHVEAAREQQLRRVTARRGVGAALPAVQQHHRAAVARRRARQEALQAHARAAVEQQLARRGEQRRRTPQDARRAASRCSPASTARGGCAASAPGGSHRQRCARAYFRSTHADLDAIVGAGGAVPVAGGELAPGRRIRRSARSPGRPPTPARRARRGWKLRMSPIRLASASGMRCVGDSASSDGLPTMSHLAKRRLLGRGRVAVHRVADQAEAPGEGLDVDHAGDLLLAPGDTSSWRMVSSRAPPRASAP